MVALDVAVAVAVALAAVDLGLGAEVDDFAVLGAVALVEEEALAAGVDFFGGIALRNAIKAEKGVGG